MESNEGKMDRAKERDTRDMRIKGGYSEVVIEHWLNPRNFGQLKSYDGYSGRITSPCGDAMWVWLRVYDNVILNATYVSDICIGAVASGSMATEMVKGKRIKDALRISSEDILRALGGLPENYIHCAALADKTLKAAIRDYNAYKDAPWKRLYRQQY